MKAKTFQVWDNDSMIPVLAVKFEPENENDRLVLRKGNCRIGGIYLSLLTGAFCITNCNADNWGGEAMQKAHLYLEKNFDTMESGAVIDRRIQ